MTEQSSNRCVVLLPAGDPHFARLFDELFAPAITEAGMLPCRIEQVSAEPLPIDRLVREIEKADAVFADLSQGGAEIWFALGCALAHRKPLCLVSSKLEFSHPLNIQDLEIIPYPVTPFPSSYSQLKKSITHQLMVKRPDPIPVQRTPLPAPISPVDVPQLMSYPSPVEAPQRLPHPPVDAPQRMSYPSPVETSQRLPHHAPVEAPQRPLHHSPVAPPQPPPHAPHIETPPADAFANTPLSAELTSHEILALKIIDTHASSEGLSPRDLGLEMQASESAHLTSHVMNSLKRRRFIERRPVSVSNGTDGYISENLFITWQGKNWLLQHSPRENSHRPNSTPSEFFMSAR
jgi:hypothetical protein